MKNKLCQLFVNPHDIANDEDDNYDTMKMTVIDDVNNKNLCQLFCNPHPHRPSAPAFLSRQHCSKSKESFKKGKNC